MYDDMNRAAPRGTRRVTCNLPETLLQTACRATGLGVTETLVEGLELVRRTSALSAARALRGRIHLDLDIDELRGRPRRR
jgi:hypothetical protein